MVISYCYLVSFMFELCASTTCSYKFKWNIWQFLLLLLSISHCVISSVPAYTSVFSHIQKSQTKSIFLFPIFHESIVFQFSIIRKEATPPFFHWWSPCIVFLFIKPTIFPTSCRYLILYSFPYYLFLVIICLLPPIIVHLSFVSTNIATFSPFFVSSHPTLPITVWWTLGWLNDHQQCCTARVVVSLPWICQDRNIP